MAPVWPTYTTEKEKGKERKHWKKEKKEMKKN